MSIHYKVYKSTRHQDQSDTSNNLATNRVPVFPFQLCIECLNYQGRQGFMDILVKLKNFRSKDNAELL